MEIEIHCFIMLQRGSTCCRTRTTTAEMTPPRYDPADKEFTLDGLNIINIIANDPVPLKSAKSKFPFTAKAIYKQKLLILPV